MGCQRRVALWCSVGILICSVVLLSLYFSCMGVCNFQHKSLYAPIWTALLCVVLTIFGFVIAFKKRTNVIATAFVTASVICMICSLVCAYLIIGALIGEKKTKSENENYMTAMFLWIAMAGATGLISIFTVIITCGFLCCQCRRKDENANTEADKAWATTAGPNYYVRDPPYAPQSTDQSDESGVAAPTAPPLFMSLTLQRETGMDISPSPDRRSFSANMVEMHNKSETSIQELVAEMNNEYTEMPTFSARDETVNDAAAKTEEVETNVNNSASGLHVHAYNVDNGGSVRYSEISKRDQACARNDEPTGDGDPAVVESVSVTTVDIGGSVRYSEITDRDEARARNDDITGDSDSAIAESDSVTTDDIGTENQYAEITTILSVNGNSDDEVSADRERAPDKEDNCAINYDYDYATTGYKLVSLPSLEDEINYVNNSLPRSPKASPRGASPISLSNSDVSFS